MTNKELKKHFDAYYKIYKKLQEFVVKTEINGREVELKVEQVYFCYDPDDCEWCIDHENYELKSHCKLSQLAETLYHGEIDWYDWHNWFDTCVFDKTTNLVGEEIKAFTENLDEDIYPSYFDNAFWQSRSLTKTRHFDSFVKKYNKFVEQHLKSMNEAVCEEKIKELPEDFISVNGVLLSKKQIKALAATL